MLWYRSKAGANNRSHSRRNRFHQAGQAGPLDISVVATKQLVPAITRKTNGDVFARLTTDEITRNQGGICKWLIKQVRQRLDYAHTLINGNRNLNVIGPQMTRNIFCKRGFVVLRRVESYRVRADLSMTAFLQQRRDQR